MFYHEANMLEYLLWWHIKDKRKISLICQVKLDIPFRFLTTNWETNHQTEAISTERAFAKICVADKGNFGEHSRALALLNTPQPGVAAQPE